jgi:hypothetical protein
VAMAYPSARPARAVCFERRRELRLRGCAASRPRAESASAAVLVLRAPVAAAGAATAAPRSCPASTAPAAPALALPASPRPRNARAPLAPWWPRGSDALARRGGGLVRGSARRCPQIGRPSPKGADPAMAGPPPAAADEVRRRRGGAGAGTDGAESVVLYWSVSNCHFSCDIVCDNLL